VATHELTNTELNAILDPTSDSYRDYLNFVYDVEGKWSCKFAHGFVSFSKWLLNGQYRLQLV
jgi:hypothetical protein